MGYLTKEVISIPCLPTNKVTLYQVGPISHVKKSSMQCMLIQLGTRSHSSCNLTYTFMNIFHQQNARTTILGPSATSFVFCFLKMDNQLKLCDKTRLVIQGKHLKTHYLQVNIKKLWPKKCHTILLCTCIYKMNIQTMNIEYPNTLYKRKIK